MSDASLIARRICVQGIVQGVGFRPFVFRLAERYGVRGWVLNDVGGVELHAEGDAGAVMAFMAELQTNPPPAARISRVAVREATWTGCAEFCIRPSSRDATPTVRITPDLPVCDDCLQEIRDPRDRRFQYPYINCTNCGPRYSIVRRLPYDRCHTTMADWELCRACQAEYDNPRDRRYHAQPTACPLCGPRFELEQNGQSTQTGSTAIRMAVELLCQGRILAVKGIGGYHLACDASRGDSVRKLRRRKFRKEKPFAVMVRSLEEAHRWADLSPGHESCLTDPARPIVLAPARDELPGVAPDSRELGVMLPYAPLHYLLFDLGAPSPLVLTSGNRSSEPIAYRDNDARTLLGGIADAFLIGQRPIARRVDDSVIAVRNRRPSMVRRARGYAPGCVGSIPVRQPILALGGDLKSAVALAVEGEVYVSQHVGDLGDLETDRAFGETVCDLLQMYGIDRHELTVVHDLHPQYTSTRFARQIPAVRYLAVQHHEAHVASVLAELEQFDTPVIGVALDGTGYGTDGTIWGGELFHGSVRDGFHRCGSLRSVRLPGGDTAARYPVQAAAGFLFELDDLPQMTEPPFDFPPRYDAARQLVAKNVRCFRSTSAGRLFDAVAALVGFTREITFEGQAAMWLENLAGRSMAEEPYRFDGLDHRVLLQQVVQDRLAGVAVERIAYRFHAGLATELAAQVRRLCQLHQLDRVAISGGVFQNQLLHELLRTELQSPDAIQILTNHKVPANDGGICLGQIALSALGKPYHLPETVPGLSRGR